MPVVVPVASHSTIVVQLVVQDESAQTLVHSEAVWTVHSLADPALGGGPTEALGSGGRSSFTGGGPESVGH